MSPELAYSIFYGFFCICFVIPPFEVSSAGFTVQNMLRGYLGDEKLNFIMYHIKRGSATLFLHSLLPFGTFVPTRTPSCHVLSAHFGYVIDHRIYFLLQDIVCYSV